MPNINTNDHEINDIPLEFNPHGRSSGDYNHMPDLDDLLPNNVRGDDAGYSWGSFIDGFCKAVCYIGNVVLLGFLTVFLYTLLIEHYPNLSVYELLPSYSNVMQRMQSHSESHLPQSEMQNIQHRLDAIQLEFQTLTRQIDAAIKYKNEIEQSFVTEQIAQIDDKIQEAIRTYDADKVAMIDYALEQSGATIHSIPDTDPYPALVSYSLLGGLWRVQPTSNPRLLLQPGTMPGQCFAFHGHSGRIRIRLGTRVKITAVTIDHAAKEVVSDTGSAPKEFKVYGLQSPDSDSMDELGCFTFTLTGRPQTFTVKPGVYQYVELRILSNYGRGEYTCVYRFRVHGDPA